MTELVAFPEQSVFEGVSMPAPPDLFVLPEPVPPLTLTINGAEYEIPAEDLEQYLRFTAEQLIAVETMRAGGVSEETIAQAFPRKVSPVEAKVTPGVESPRAAAVSPSPAPAPARVPGSGRPDCNHSAQFLDKMTGTIYCAGRGCDKVILEGAGFVDNTNPAWNGRTRAGAAIPNAVQVLGTGQLGSPTIYRAKANA